MRISTRASGTDAAAVGVRPAAGPSRNGVGAPAAPPPGLRAGSAARQRTRPWYLDVWVQIVRRKPLGTVGGVIVIGMLAAAVLADAVAPYGYADTSLRERFIAMSAAHPLGTDQIGRDLDFQAGLFRNSITVHLQGCGKAHFFKEGRSQAGRNFPELINIAGQFFDGTAYNSILPLLVHSLQIELGSQQ